MLSMINETKRRERLTTSYLRGLTRPKFDGRGFRLNPSLHVVTESVRPCRLGSYGDVLSGHDLKNELKK